MIIYLFSKVIMMKTYEKIRELRERNNWRQEDIAKQISLSPQGYAKIERGETRLTLHRLEQLANIFDVEIGELISSDNHFFYQDNKNTHNQGHVVYQTSNLSEYSQYEAELDKLRLTLQHKDEMIAKMQEQIDDLRNLNKVLSIKIQ